MAGQRKGFGGRRADLRRNREESAFGNERGARLMSGDSSDAMNRGKSLTGRRGPRVYIPWTMQALEALVREANSTVSLQ